MKKFVFFLLLPFFSLGQDLTEAGLLSKLSVNGAVSADLLSKRSVVLHHYTLTSKELSTVHQNLVNTGADAVAYFATDKVLSGPDVVKAYAQYFNRREISMLIIITKAAGTFGVYVTPYNNTVSLVTAGQSAWSCTGPSLSECMLTLYRSALVGNKPKNLLINETPETDLPVTVVGGRRAEIFAHDLKVDMLAVPKFGDAEKDKALEEVLKFYPLKYQLVDNTVSEEELRKKGFLYILTFVHTRASAARSVLEYPIKAGESAFVSVTYPESEVVLKNIAGETPVYKFYVRHIDSGNIFLGLKWDADITWEQALLNYIKGMKLDLRIN